MGRAELRQGRAGLGVPRVIGVGHVRTIDRTLYLLCLEIIVSNLYLHITTNV